MGYGQNSYNYQIAVIFAILIGAVLLLLFVFIAIYFVTKAMRGDDPDKKSTRYPSGRNSSQWPSQAPSYRPASQQQQNQSFDFPQVRTPVVAPSPAMNIQTPAPYSQHLQAPMPYSQSPQQYNPQYSQVPLVTPVNQEYNVRSSQLQPDVIYTQGPSGFTRSQPVEYTTFHQSSV